MSNSMESNIDNDVSLKASPLNFVQMKNNSSSSGFNYSGDGEYRIKILTLGDSGVGKTCFLNYYTEGFFVESERLTVGIDFKHKQVIYHPEEKSESKATKHKGYKINLQLWDTAGQERFRSLTIAFLRDAMGFILVFDITCISTFHNIELWIEHLKTHSLCNNPDIVLCGNKCDLEEEVKISDQKINEYANSHGLKYFRTSAITGENISEAMNYLIGLIIGKMMNSFNEETDLTCFQSDQQLNNHISSISSGKYKAPHYNCSC